MAPSALQSQRFKRNHPETPPPGTGGPKRCEVHCRWCSDLRHKRGWPWQQPGGVHVQMSAKGHKTQRSKAGIQVQRSPISWTPPDLQGTQARSRKDQSNHWNATSAEPRRCSTSKRDGQLSQSLPSPPVRCHEDPTGTHAQASAMVLEWRSRKGLERSEEPHFHSTRFGLL